MIANPITRAIDIVLDRVFINVKEAKEYLNSLPKEYQYEVVYVK
ncbi:hypothetical protein [Cetobacterium sp.]